MGRSCAGCIKSSSEYRPDCLGGLEFQRTGTRQVIECDLFEPLSHEEFCQQIKEDDLKRQASKLEENKK